MMAFFDRLTPFTEKAGKLTTSAVDWLLDVVTTLNQVPLRKQIVRETAKQAAIAATAINLGLTVPAGYYRVSVYLRLTQAATTSSSVTPIVGWTDDTGQARTVSGTPYTGNAITTCAVPFAPVIRIQANSVITYAVSYGSVGATPAIYAVDVICERIPEMPT